ncbi:MAG: lytic transglycosylase domain-containing protein [Pseudomonadota bacterium]
MRVWHLVLAIGLFGSAHAQAQEVVASKSRAQLLSNQLSVLDGRAKGQYANSIRLKPVVPDVGRTGGGAAYDGSYQGPYLILAEAAARRNRVPRDLFLKLVTQESGWNPKARSHKGAYGLAQLMPATAKYLGVNPRDPKDNLDGGAKYLREQFDAFGSWRLALAAYNAGPGAVKKHGGIPPYKETRDYVRIIYGR